jgi:hypothetical protein
MSQSPRPLDSPSLPDSSFDSLIKGFLTVEFFMLMLGDN